MSWTMFMNSAITYMDCLVAKQTLHISASEMTYIVSSGALNSTHSLTRWIC